MKRALARIPTPSCSLICVQLGHRELLKMVTTCKIYKKMSPNGKVTLYLPKREFIDHIMCVDPIDGVVLLDDEYLKHRHVYAHVIATFRYGREDDEVMGLRFVKELYLGSQCVYPPPEGEATPASRVQQKLLEKLGPNAYTFTLTLPENAPHSVLLQSGGEEQGQPCGVYYEVRVTVGTSPHDKGHKRSSVSLSMRKVQRARLAGRRQPCGVVRKDFLLSPGYLELEATLDRQVFAHGETVAVNVAVRNYSSRTVKRIKVYGIQNADICMFASGHCRTVLTCIDTESGCPVGPGATLHKVVEVRLGDTRGPRGVALDVPVGDEPVSLASSTIFPEDQEKEPFGIIVSYAIKVKLVLGALGGEVVAELPFVLMNPGSAKGAIYEHEMYTEAREGVENGGDATSKKDD